VAQHVLISGAVVRTWKRALALAAVLTAAFTPVGCALNPRPEDPGLSEGNGAPTSANFGTGGATGSLGGFANASGGGSPSFGGSGGKASLEDGGPDAHDAAPRASALTTDAGSNAVDPDATPTSSNSGTNDGAVQGDAEAARGSTDARAD